LSKLIFEIVDNYKNCKINEVQNHEIYFTGRKNLIQRCIINIINNANNFAEEISVNLRKIKNNIIIIIEDNGPGIPENEYDNVFKPFYKIDKSRNQNKSSVGLGMSIASDIIKSHGGNIELGKANLGGLKVKISLPS